MYIHGFRIEAITITVNPAGLPDAPPSDYQKLAVVLQKAYQVYTGKSPVLVADESQSTDRFGVVVTMGDGQLLGSPEFDQWRRVLGLVVIGDLPNRWYESEGPDSEFPEQKIGVKFRWSHTTEYTIV